MRFFMISDLHLGNPKNNQLAKENFRLLALKIREEISSYESLLFVVLGDIREGTSDKDYKTAGALFNELKSELSDFNVIFEFIPGNHDLIGESLEIFDQFIKTLGADYSYMDSAVFSKEHFGVNFIFADSTLTRDYKSAGKLDLKAIRVHIRENMQNILFCHHALTHKSEDEHNCVENGESVSKALKEMGIDFCFHSHTHTCDTSFSMDHISEIGCGSISKDINDMPEINNQFSVGGIRDGKLVGIERWIKVKDGPNNYVEELLYPSSQKFIDPKNIGKIKYDELTAPYIIRKIIKSESKTVGFFCSQNETKTIYETLGENGRIFLLGDAGDGKTIELDKLAHDLDETPYFPFRFYLRNYTGDNIESILPEKYRGLNPERLVIIFDGYDEIQEKYRHDFEAKLNVYLENNSNVRIIISARKNFCKINENGKSNTLAGFTEYLFTPISDDNIIEYLKNRDIHPEKFITAAKKSRVETLIYNPFYLDGLSEIYLDSKTLPSKKEIMEKLINLRFLKDSNKFYDKDLDDNKIELLKCLEKVALAIQLMGENQLTDDEYQELISLEHRKLIKSSGIFSRKDNIWRFTHNNFREYLAAKCLSRMSVNNVIEYCCAGSEIKPSWLNTFGYISDLTQDNELRNWMMVNACEALVKFNPDNLDSSERFEIFKHVFEKYETDCSNAYEGICTEEELAEFACCVEGINYLINKLENYVNCFSLHNALRILQHLPDAHGKQTDIKNILLKLCSKYPQTRPTDCRGAIHVICRLGLFDKNITKQLIEFYGNCEDDYIRTGMYEYLVYTNEHNKYVNFFLDGIRFIKKFINSSNRIGNESWELINGLKSMSTKESICAVLSWFSNTEYPDFYGADDVFCTIVSKCAELYLQSSHELFDVLFDCWIWAAKHFRQKEAAAVSSFFAETGSCVCQVKST